MMFPGGAGLRVTLPPFDPQSAAPRPDVATPGRGPGGRQRGAESAAAGAADQRAATGTLGDVVPDAGAGAW